MNQEKNKAMAHRWFTEGWTGKLALADELFTPQFSINGKPVGPAGPKRNNTNRLKGFPDLTVKVEDQFVVEDKVVTRLRWRGTHSGEYSGIQPTGKRVEVMTINIFRFAGDKVVESWSITDQFGVLKQIGFLPPEISGALIVESEPH